MTRGSPLVGAGFFSGAEKFNRQAVPANAPCPRSCSRSGNPSNRGSRHRKPALFRASAISSLKATTLSKSSCSTSILATCPWCLTLTCAMPSVRRNSSERPILLRTSASTLVPYGIREARHASDGLSWVESPRACGICRIFPFVRPASRRGSRQPALRPHGVRGESPPGRRHSTLPRRGLSRAPGRSPRPGRKGAACSNSIAGSCSGGSNRRPSRPSRLLHMALRLIPQRRLPPRSRVRVCLRFRDEGEDPLLSQGIEGRLEEERAVHAARIADNDRAEGPQYGLEMLVFL